MASIAQQGAIVIQEISSGIADVENVLKRRKKGRKCSNLSLRQLLDAIVCNEKMLAIIRVTNGNEDKSIVSTFIFLLHRIEVCFSFLSVMRRTETLCHHFALSWYRSTKTEQDSITSAITWFLHQPRNPHSNHNEDVSVLNNTS